ncbi:MAG: M3 family metallopeptidase [Saprospiraceae bacterium]|nr:M3 family metallopeptidase [Candidatus Vicinibacter affinis]
MFNQFQAVTATILMTMVFNNCTSGNEKQVQTPPQNSNPIIQKWEGPHNGVPAFDKIQVADFLPAFEIGMREKSNEISIIANNPEAPNFQNTIEALEKSGNTLKRVQSIYYVWTSNMSTPEMENVQTTIEPKLAAFADSITQNTPLFLRIESVYNSPEKTKLNPEQQRLVWRYYTNYVLAGGKLDSISKKEWLKSISNLLDCLPNSVSISWPMKETNFLELTSEKDLDGLPEGIKTAAAESANAKNKKGSWIIANTRSSIEPFLSYSTNRELREKAWRMFINRGDNGDANDNNAIITEILQLRAERAKLLGYPTHAHWRLADKMAQTPEKAMALLESVWPAAVERVKEEVKDMQALADKEGAKIKIEPWDYRFYSEKVRKSKFDLDQDEVKQYLQLEKLREGMFYVAGELFNLEFTQVNDVPVFHPDVRVFKVSDKTNKNQIGLWYFDPYARKGKRSGAWMTAYRDQEKLNGNITTIVSNNCNFIKGKPDEPVLISWDDAETLFHEFGHALHGLNSNVTYPLLSGTSVATDYVEFPSQILERWLSTPEVLQKYALHFKTGETIPDKLLTKIKNAATFNQGFATVEYLSSALIDMKLHLAGSTKIDPDVFEKETLATMNMPAEIVMRHRTPQFGHIFADDGYSAGYYSYLWSDVLSADAYEAFVEGKGPYDKEVGKRLVDNIFSVGGTIDEATAYRNFRGHDPNSNALMKNRGFKVMTNKK